MGSVSVFAATVPRTTQAPLPERMETSKPVSLLLLSSQTSWTASGPTGHVASCDGAAGGDASWKLWVLVARTDGWL
jgi:hypothetical protein